MDCRFLNATFSLADLTWKVRRVLAKYLRTRTALVDKGYRPELYYMRGPGPKWREAHASARNATGRIGRATAEENKEVIGGSIAYRALVKAKAGWARRC